MRSWVVALVVACGGTPPAQPQQPIARTTTPAATTCTDVGVILRGPVEDGKAGPAREAAIAQACTADTWSAATLACVGKNRKPSTCLDNLTHAQHVGLDARLAQWSQQFGGSMYGGDTAAPHYTDCADVTGDVGRYPPALADTSPERAWDIDARVRVVAKSCEYGSWQELTKECLETATTPDQVAACMLDEPTHDALERELTVIDALAAKLAAAKQKPASIDCKQVAAAWYVEPRWKDKLAALKPAERAKQLATSRAAMQKACVADKWTDTTRACLVADGGERCFDIAKLYATVWTPLVVPANAPPECTKYAADMQRVLACDKLPTASRDAMKQAFDSFSVAFGSLSTTEARAGMASNCKVADDALVQAAKAACNW